MIYDLKEFELNFYLTRKCNLDCSHCYIDRDFRKDEGFLPVSKIEEVLLDMEKFFSVNSFDTLNIGMFGGEITQLEPEYLIETMDSIEGLLKRLSPKSTLRFKGITNLVTKSFDNYLEVFRRFDVVGVSYDMDVNRFNRFNFDIWERNLLTLQGLGKSITLNLTITNRVIGREEEFLRVVSDHKIESVHLGYYVPTGINKENNLRPTHRQHTDFCINFLERLRISDLKGVRVSPVEGMISALQQGEFSGGIICEIFNSLNIDTNGVVSLCTAVGGNDDLPEQVIGNVNSDKVSEILKSKRYYKELLSMLNPNDICSDCEYRALCKQGCKILSEYGMEEGECWGYKGLWDYLSSSLSR